ncbi:hypothetical protein [Terriglobus sp. RCC_193]|uniref:hypothetical protein n=1 Tax=Terriglobus sp. RCC_193 TaxID=3239218 RepID=UPI00352444E3
MEKIGRSYVTLPLMGALAVGAGVVAFVAPRPMRISGAQLVLKATGTGAGNTTAQIKVGANNILKADLTIAGAAATKYVKQSAKGGGVPSGYDVNEGDVITVDITAIPATTAPTDGYVILHIAQVEV